ncbi:LysR family transcriptional regulator [Dethiobacter alkaliphilus]|uniref:LysR family transcriptional regulator n=1 Tax=Dethiobacter alkaliphilus TaxID=427926 RepID=UPI002225F25A|nr:LysR family transcriptional regulator [Dethiobacter alkaliphilus]MCW3491702.1 LysR family transcriptional regulator [Dethiobacter alkaliphilus]
MNLALIQVFYEVSRSGSLTTAAEKLHISQPALSRQISSLEKEVGLDLFIRHSRGLQLTEPGRRLYEYAQKILSYADEAQRVLDEIKNIETGTLKIGVSKTIGSYLLPPVIAKFVETHPGVDISVELENRETLIRRTTDLAYDVVLLSGSFNEPGFYVETLLNDEIIALTSPNHKELTNIINNLERLNNELFILREVGSSTREFAESLMSGNNIKPHKIIELPSIEAIKRTVMAGIGITFLSKYTVFDELQNGTLKSVAVSNFSIKRPIISVQPKAGRVTVFCK